MEKEEIVALIYGVLFDKKISWSRKRIEIFSASLRSQNVAILKFGIENSVPKHLLCKNIIRGRDQAIIIDMLKIIFSKYGIDCFNNCAYSLAAEMGHLEVLKWLRTDVEKQYPGQLSWGPQVCEKAARGGHLEVLMWLRTPSSEFGTPCPWDHNTCSGAASEGRLEILKWLRTSDEKYGTPCEWSYESCHFAAASGHLDVLKWLRTPNEKYGTPCHWQSPITIHAAEHGQLEVLKWLRTPSEKYGTPCRWHELIFSYAAMEGQVEVLKWLTKIDQKYGTPCPFNKPYFRHIYFDNLYETLEWLRKYSFPYRLTVKCTKWAIKNKDYKLFLFLRNNIPPCPWNKILRKRAEKVFDYYETD